MHQGRPPPWATEECARQWSPCQVLYAALLWDALHCLHAPKIKRRDWRDARAWIAQGTVGKVSFEQVCDVLHFEPDGIRRALAGMMGGLVYGPHRGRYRAAARTRPLRHTHYVGRARKLTRRRRSR